MAPEQARGLPVDHRADVFAFGCVMYELLDITTGRRTTVREIAVDDPSGMVVAPDLYLSADAQSYVYGSVRTLSTLYLVTGLR